MIIRLHIEGSCAEILYGCTNVYLGGEEEDEKRSSGTGEGHHNRRPELQYRPGVNVQEQGRVFLLHGWGFGGHRP